MRTQHIALFAATALMSLTAAAAPQGPEKEVVEIRSSHRQVNMPAFAFDRVQGEYALEDGRILQVTGKVGNDGRRLYADLGNGPVELVHVGKKRFVAVGQDLSVRFQGDKIPDTVFVRDAGRREVASSQR